MADSTNLAIGSLAQSIVMSSEDRTRHVDLTGLLVSCDITESIDQVTMTGALIIEDTQDLIGEWGMTGAEYITVTWQSPMYDEEPEFRDHIFRVAEIMNITANELNTSKTIQISLVSALSYENIFSSVNLIIKEKIQSGVQKIFDNLVSDGEQRGLIPDFKPTLAHCHKTDGIGNIVIPGMSPFDAIELLTAMAINIQEPADKDPASAFAFFENWEGFNFVNLTKHFYDKKKSFKEKTFTYTYNAVNTAQGLRDQQPSAEIAYNPISVSQLRRNNIYQLAKSGALGNGVNRVDFLTKQVDHQAYSHTTPDYMNKVNVSEAFKEHYSDPNAKKVTWETHWAYIDSSNPIQENITEAIIRKTALMNLLYNNMVQVVSYGNSSLSAGEVMKLNVLAATGNKKSLHTDEFMSGYYIIKDVTHQLRPGDVYRTSSILTRIGNNESATKNEVSG